MPKIKKEKEENKVLYMKVASIENVCRRVCNFDFTSDTLILSKFQAGSRLIYFAERTDSTQIAYYANTSEVDGMIVYEPGGEGVAERASFTSKTDLPNKYYISILRADLEHLPATEVLNEKEVHIIKVNNPIDLVGAAIRKASRDETMASIYSFESDGKKIIAAFNVLDSLSNDKLVFYYSVIAGKRPENFARYDYRNNSLDFSNTIDDHAYMYAKIIHLVQPFPFMV